MTELLTIPQAAERLSVSPRTMYRLIQGGNVRAIKVRGCVRVLPDSLRAYINGLAGVHNPEGAGQASIEEQAKRCQSAKQEKKNGTRTASTSARTHRSGGHAGQDAAAKQLAARLGLG